MEVGITTNEKPKGRKTRGLKDKSGLKLQHLTFIDNYMVSYNGTRAAKAAGYSGKSAHTTAHELLSNPKIVAEIVRRRHAAAENLSEISRPRIELEMARCGLANMGDYMTAGDDGSPQLNFAHLTRDQTAALQEVTVEEFKDGRSDKRQVRRIKFRLVDKRGALELLAKVKGMLVEKVDHSHLHQGTIMHALLREIDETVRGKPVVEAIAGPEGENPE